MEVHLQQAGKRFEGRSILQNIELRILPGSRCLITGPNGAGKSTLLKLIASFLRPSTGLVEHRIDGKPIEADRVYPHIALAAPYLSFPEDLSVIEIIKNWGRFRTLKRSPEKIPGLVDLEEASDRPLRELSSGMEQRLKLAVAFCTESPLLLLDEPLTNIDAKGKDLYHRLLQEESDERSILVCSNDPSKESPSDAVRYRLDDGKLVAS